MNLIKEILKPTMNKIPKATFQNFVNGIKHPELYLWDAWSYVEENIFHLYSLAVSKYKDDGSIIDPNDRNDYPFHIRHFSSNDNGKTWIDEGCFFNIDDCKGLNYRTIWSGSINPMLNGNKLFAYTGIEKVDSNHCYSQNISIAISSNGYNVNSFKNKVLSSPKQEWDEISSKGYYIDNSKNFGNNKGEENGPIMAWRDPFIFYDQSGELNLFWSAKVSPKTGALARATLEFNGELFKIKELFPPVLVPDYKDFTQLEVPKVLFNNFNNQYYLIISTCNRLNEEQFDSEISKEVRIYKSIDINGPWESLGDKILKKENLFGLTVLKPDFENNRLLCMAPYTEFASIELMLTFAPRFYIYLDNLRIEFLN